MSESEHLEVSPDLNDEMLKEISNDSEIQISIASENESQEDFEESKDDSCDKSFSQLGDSTKQENLNSDPLKIHDGHRGHKFESFGKLFSHEKKPGSQEEFEESKDDSCDKSFFQMGDLIKQEYLNSDDPLKLHDGGYRGHKCEFCGKSFSKDYVLKKHIHTIHEDHKDYKCESCCKSFSQSGNLRRHIKTVHEGRKDYKCETMLIILFEFLLFANNEQKTDIVRE